MLDDYPENQTLFSGLPLFPGMHFIRKKNLA